MVRPLPCALFTIGYVQFVTSYMTDWLQNVETVAH